MATTTIAILLMIAAVILWLINTGNHINTNIKKALSFSVTIAVIIIFTIFLN